MSVCILVAHNLHHGLYVLRKLSRCTAGSMGWNCVLASVGIFCWNGMGVSIVAKVKAATYDILMSHVAEKAPQAEG